VRGIESRKRRGERERKKRERRWEKKDRGVRKREQ
jgi:hypothetical protein